MSITLQIFSANTSLSDPPNTVKSWENTQIGRPNTVPYPVTTASPQGRLSRMPNSTSRWRTKRSSSTNDPGSSSRSTRSRASSLPRACCFSTAADPTGNAASALSSSSQRSFASVVSCVIRVVSSTAIAPEPIAPAEPLAGCERLEV